MPASLRTLDVEQRYRDRLRALQRQSAIVVARRLASIDRSRLSEELRTALPSMASTIALTQEAAQLLATSFVVELVAAETGGSFMPLARDRRIPGTTIDGRPIAGALGSVSPALFLALRRGMPVDRAVAIGVHVSARIAATETSDAASRETIRQVAGSRRLAGWTWVAHGGACGACLAMANGVVRNEMTAMNKHAGCSCVATVVVRDVPDRVPRPTGRQIFDGLPPDQQEASFRTGGAAKAAAVRDGRIELADLVKVDEARVWRPMITEKPLGDLAAALDIGG